MAGLSSGIRRMIQAQKARPVVALIAGDTGVYPGTHKQTYLLVLCAAGPIQRPHYGGSRMDKEDEHETD